MLPHGNSDLPPRPASPLRARTCAHCGKPGGCFAFTMMRRVGKPERGYYHPNCFRAAKALADKA